MKKHHLFLAYIFLCIFSFESFGMDETAVVNSRGDRFLSLFKRGDHHKGLPQRQAGQPKLEKTTQPPTSQPPVPIKTSQTSSLPKRLEPDYSQLFPGAEKLSDIVIEKRGPMGVPNATTDHAVSVCSISGQAFVAFIDNTDGHVKVVQSKDLLHWTQPADIFGDLVKGATYVNCFIFQNHPYVTCGGKVTFSNDGKTWEKPYDLQHAENSLFVTMFQKKNLLLAAHTGIDHHVHLTTSKDGRTWEPLLRVQNWQTELPVSLTFWGNSVQIGWIANSGKILFSTFASDLDSHWARTTEGLEITWKSSHTIKQPISVCSHAGSVKFAFLSERSNIYFSSTNDTIDWTEPRVIEKLKTEYPVCIFTHTFLKPTYAEDIIIAHLIKGQIYLQSAYAR